MNDLTKSTKLGKSVDYHTEIPDSSLLVGIPRHSKRTEMGIENNPLPFHGFDLWNAYEFSWLRPNGRPEVAILSVSVPVSSPCLIESKSFKLYLNSFNQTKIEKCELEKMLLKDLSECAGSSLTIKLQNPKDLEGQQLKALSGLCLDDLNPEGPYSYLPEPSLLQTEDVEVEETLTSSLLKSNCLITNQPDWADIQIFYNGPQIKHAELLKYFISFRMKNEFHEPCVEKIYHDIMTHCKPKKLSVLAQYTRRGGLDINPYRSSFMDTTYDFHRTPRQ